MNDNIYLDVYIKVLNIVIIISFHKNWRIVNKIIDLQGYTMKKAFLVSPPHKPPPKHMARKTLLSYGNVKKTTAGSKCQENNNNNSQEDSKLNKNGNTMEKTLNSESKVEVGSILSIKPRKEKTRRRGGEQGRENLHRSHGDHVHHGKRNGLQARPLAERFCVQQSERQERMWLRRKFFSLTIFRSSVTLMPRPNLRTGLGG